MNPRIVKEYAAKMSAEAGRRVTLRQAEEEIVGVIERVARTLAPNFVFGYHTRADIEQEGVAEALAVLLTDKYDVRRPLENFLYVHVHNRLHNFRRKHFLRLERACTCCDPFDPPAFPCRKWRQWHARNLAKQNIMRPLDVSAVSDEGETRMAIPSAVEDEAEVNEMLRAIDELLPLELRADYLRMRHQAPVPKGRRERVREAVLAILRPEWEA